MSTPMRYPLPLLRARHERPPRCAAERSNEFRVVEGKS
jgi:hypothetical protein